METNALTTSSPYSTAIGPVLFPPQRPVANVETVTSRQGPYANGFVYDTTAAGYLSRMMAGTVTLDYDATDAASGIYLSQMALTTTGMRGMDGIYSSGPFTYIVTYKGTTTTGSSGIPTIIEMETVRMWSHEAPTPHTYGFADINVDTTGVHDSPFSTHTITILSTPTIITLSTPTITTLSTAPMKLPVVGLLLLAFVSFILVL